MDKCFENLNRSISGDDKFWFICNSDGYVNMCSSAAVKYGITVRSDDCRRVVHDDSLADLEDVFRMVKLGGEVSVLLEACEDTGYSVVHVRNGVLFSEPVAEIRLYKSKNEYLDDPQRNTTQIGRVFGRIDELESDGKSIDAFSASVENLKNRLSEFEGSAARLYSGFGLGISAEDSLIDVSEIFDSVADIFLASDRKPFCVEFKNYESGIPVVCLGKPENIVGAVLASAATSVRMSCDGKCRAILRCDGDSVVIEAQSKLGVSIPTCFRSCDFSWLYAATGKGVSELVFFERILAFAEYNAEFMSDIDGNFVIRVTVNKNTDSDRLKFRDGTIGTESIAHEYIAYLNESFLSDTQQQSEY